MSTKRPLDILAENQAKKFKKLFEYNFYLNDKPEAISEDDKDPSAEEPTDAEPDLDSMEKDIESELGLDDTSGDIGGGEEEIPEPEIPQEEPPMEAPAPPIEEPATDEVEIDVTEIIKNTEDNNKNIMAAIQQMKQMQNQLQRMDNISNNISNLETQIQKVADEIKERNPTPNEKIEMRSLDSFPYNLKLSDFWGQNPNKFTGVETKEEGKPEEYVLKQSDIDNFSDSEIKKSFNDYEEEDIF